MDVLKYIKSAPVNGTFVSLAVVASVVKNVMVSVDAKNMSLGVKYSNGMGAEITALVLAILYLVFGFFKVKLGPVQPFVPFIAFVSAVVLLVFFGMWVKDRFLMPKSPAAVGAEVGAEVGKEEGEKAKKTGKSPSEAKVDAGGEAEVKLIATAGEKGVPKEGVQQAAAAAKKVAGVVAETVASS